jgi:hypothetical protein
MLMRVRGEGENTPLHSSDPRRLKIMNDKGPVEIMDPFTPQAASFASRVGNAEPPTLSGFRVLVLHDDYISARKGKFVSRRIVDEMGLTAECETVLWNIDLLGTIFGRVAEVEASTAHIVIIAIRCSSGFSFDLKLWLRRWLASKKHDSVALIAVFENNDEATADARAFIERAAQNAGKSCFSQSIKASASQEFLWVL